MLNYEKGRPIAKVSGGQYDGEIIYIDEDTNGNYINSDLKKSKKDPLSYLDNGFYGKKRKKKMRSMDINTLNKHIKLKRKPLDDDMADAYDEAIKVIDDKFGKEIIIEDEGIITPLPNKDKVERLYIAGPSDSGKSSYASRYVSEFRKMFRNKKFYVFSRSDEDPIIDKNSPLRIEMNEKLIEKPIAPNELKNTIVLFDDIDTGKTSKIRNAVQDLRDDLLQTGRKEFVYTLTVSHILLDYQNTRVSINESTSVTFFPKFAPAHAIQFLKRYAGLKKDQIDKIMDLPSRWVTFYKTYPTYIIYEKGCYLL